MTIYRSGPRSSNIAQIHTLAILHDDVEIVTLFDRDTISELNGHALHSQHDTLDPLQFKTMTIEHPRQCAPIAINQKPRLFAHISRFDLGFIVQNHVQ